MGSWSKTLAVPLLALATLFSAAATSAAPPATQHKKPAQPMAAGKLSTVSAPAQPVTVILATVSDKAAVGTLTLLVKSPAAGTLRLRFIVMKTGDFADTNRADRDSPPVERPVVFEQDGKLTILKGQTRLLRIRFAISPEAQAGLVDGLLIIRLAPSKPAKASPASIVIATKGQRGTSPTGGLVSPQPPSPSLSVTSVFPFKHKVLFGEHQTVLLPPQFDEVHPRQYVVYLGSESAGRLRLTLQRSGNEGSSGGMTPSELVVDKVGRVGKYTGDVVLGPGANEKLALTVHVRDFFLWPFIALLLGALLGGLGIKRWEHRRRRALLTKQVKDAFGVYEAALKKRPTNDRPPVLDPDPKSRRDELIEAIDNADSDDDYNKQVDAVSAYESELRRWLRLATAADALVARNRELPEAAVEAREDAATVLGKLNLKLDDPKDAERVAEQAERLAEILSIFVPVWSLWVQVGSPRRLSPKEAYVGGAFTKKSASLELRGELEELRDKLRALPAPEYAVGVVRFAREPRVLESILIAAGLPLPWKPFDQLEPKAIEHRVRLYDWAIGTASLLVTLLAYLLTKYGQDYGTLSDYAQAFTAGFLGQLAGATIAWNLFPPFRSYRAIRTDATSPASA